MGRRCCCVQPGCEIGEDDFNRADSAVNEIGPKWEALSGEWRIDDNKLVCDTPGVLATTICHPSAYPLGSFYMFVDLIDPVGVGSYKVRAGHPTESDYEVHVLFEGEPSNGTITVTVHGDDHVAEWTGPWLAEENSPRRLWVCYAPGVHLSSIVDSGGFDPQAPLWVTACIGDTGAKRCFTVNSKQVGNFSFLEGAFDDWDYEVHWIENHDCLRCDCHCHDPKEKDDACQKENLTLSLTAVHRECNPLEGDYPLNQVGYFATAEGQVPDLVSPFPEKLAWITPTITCELSNGNVSGFRVLILCDLSTIKMQWKIAIIRGDPEDCDQHPNINFEEFGQWDEVPCIPQSSSCDPFYLLFPNIKLTADEETEDWEIGYSCFCDIELEWWDESTHPRLKVEVTEPL